MPSRLFKLCATIIGEERTRKFLDFSTQMAGNDTSQVFQAACIQIEIGMSCLSVSEYEKW